VSNYLYQPFHVLSIQIIPSGPEFTSSPWSIELFHIVLSPDPSNVNNLSHPIHIGSPICQVFLIPYRFPYCSICLHPSFPQVQPSDPLHPIHLVHSKETSTHHGKSHSFGFAHPSRAPKVSQVLYVGTVDGSPLHPVVQEGTTSIPSIHGNFHAQLGNMPISIHKKMYYILPL